MIKLSLIHILTAKKLEADFRIISQSGWGVLSSWDNDPKCAIPKYYEKVCGVVNGERNEELGAYEYKDVYKRQGNMCWR